MHGEGVIGQGDFNAMRAEGRWTSGLFWIGTPEAHFVLRWRPGRKAHCVWNIPVSHQVPIQNEAHFVSEIPKSISPCPISASDGVGSGDTNLLTCDDFCVESFVFNLIADR